MILAIDTATENASVALARPDGSIAAELTWRAGRNHTMHLHPTLRHVMMLAAIEPKDLTGIVATRGPGSFTGIRIGLARPKGWRRGSMCQSSACRLSPSPRSAQFTWDRRCGLWSARVGGNTPLRHILRLVTAASPN